MGLEVNAQFSVLIFQHSIMQYFCVFNQILISVLVSDCASHYGTFQREKL